MAAASSPVNPGPRKRGRLPSLRVTPAAGLVGRCRLLTAHPNTAFRPARSESFTVLGEMGLPVLGFTSASRLSLKRITSSGVTREASSCPRKATSFRMVFPYDSRVLDVTPVASASRHHASTSPVNVRPLPAPTLGGAPFAGLAGTHSGNLSGRLSAV